MTPGATGIGGPARQNGRARARAAGRLPPRGTRRPRGAHTQFGVPDEHWGDTNLRFMIRRTGLAEGRFDRVISSAEFGG